MGQTQIGPAQPKIKLSLHPPLIILLGIAALVMFVLTGYLMFGTNTFFPPQASPVPFATPTTVVDNTNYSFINPFTVTIKVDQSSPSSSTVYIKNINSDNEELFGTFANVYTQQIRPADYVNGSLYIIRRTSGKGWTDQLWRYEKNGKGQLLYSLRGLSFLVSPGGTYIAVTNNESVMILNGQGRILRTLGGGALLSIGSDAVFIGDMAGPTLTGLLSVRFADLDVVRFDISTLDIGTEYAVNPARNLFAYSDYPALFDVSSAENFKKSGTEVTLSVYNLNAKTNEVIAHSRTLQFSPVWVSADTLEYTSATGSGTVEKKF